MFFSVSSKSVAVCAALCAVLAACGRPAAPSSDEGEASAGVLNVYSARHYDSDRVLYQAFEDQTGIDVRFRESKAPELLETLRAEGDSSPADVIIAADAGALYRFQAAGLTQPVSSDILTAAIPETLREVDGHWFGLAKRARVIAYDPERLSPEDVATYANLAEGKLQGELCVRSSTNIYNLSLMGEIIGREGSDAAQAWARSIVANFARQPQGGDTTQIEAIAAGECSAAIVNHYYWVRLAQSTSEAKRAVAAKTALSFPNQETTGTHTNITGAAVAANAPNRDAAIAFIEFLITPEGQALLTTETKEIPIVEGVPMPEGLDALPAFQESDFPLTDLGALQGEAQTLFDRAGWN